VRGEVGASLCVTVDGETVVDLWGGSADLVTGRPWDADTLTMVWSCTKGATSLCAHLLADRGELDLDAPVTRYWPEFAKNGKADVPVRMLLNHQVGLPAVREFLPNGAFADWDLMVETLAAEEPFWEPGTRHGYHALTFGWLVGEVVRRVSGQSLGHFFAENVAGPLDLDFWIGLPDAHEWRVAPAIPAIPAPDQPLPPFFEAALSDPQSVPGLVLLNNGGLMADPNSRTAHGAQLGAAGGDCGVCGRKVALIRAPPWGTAPLSLGPGPVDGAGRQMRVRTAQPWDSSAVGEAVVGGAAVGEAAVDLVHGDSLPQLTGGARGLADHGVSVRRPAWTAPGPGLDARHRPRRMGTAGDNR
jgi:CubicO group peptidase (beta-lactamase class C family)